MRVKSLTQEGIDHLYSLYNQFKERSIDLIKMDNFNEDLHIRNIQPNIEIQRDISFNDRFEMGKYLNNIFLDNMKYLRKNKVGIWSWIAILWFDTIAPKSNGKRKIHRSEKYICQNHYQKYYRHLISGPFEIYHIHKKYSRIMLKKDLDTVGDAIEQLAGQGQGIISSKKIIRAADMLYWDENNNEVKTGANSKKDGGIRRFVAIIKQLKMTYDIYSCTPEKIIELLPEEFEKWK